MENYEIKLNQALDLINNEDYTAAVAILKQLAQIDSNNVEIYKNLGLCEINLDNPIEAKNAFLKAVERAFLKLAVTKTFLKRTTIFLKLIFTDGREIKTRYCVIKTKKLQYLVFFSLDK